MVEIRQVKAGFEVNSPTFRETFQSRFKALMAAHAVALGEATAGGRPVPIMLPEAWGEHIVVEPRILS